jgi:hypothetical protein
VSLAHAIAYFSWPVFALGGAGYLFLQWRKRRKSPPSPLLELLVFVLLYLPVISTIAFGEMTQANLLDKNIAFVLGGLLILILAVRMWRNAAKPSPTQPKASPARKRISAVMTVIVGAGIVVTSIASIVGDFIERRVEYKGFVTGKYVTHSRYGAERYHLKINGYAFPITEDLYEQISLAKHVKVEAGRMSHTIFRVYSEP